MKSALLILAALVILLIGAVGFLYLVRPDPQSLGLRLAPDATATPGEITVRWLGVSTLLIDDGQTQLMTDGFISRPDLLDLLLDREIAPDEVAIDRALAALQVDRLKAIMTVHSHYDHAMDTGVVALRTGAEVLGSTSTANVARGAGVSERQIREIVPGQTYQFGAFSVRFFAGQHAPLADGGPPMPGEISEPLVPPQPVSAWREGGSFTILIEHPTGDMLIVGSAGYVAQAHQGLDVDAVFLGIGGLSSLPRDHVQNYVYESVHLPRAEQVYVIHHDDLSAPYGDIRLMPKVVMGETFVFELSQLVLPAQMYALEFDQPVTIRTGS